MKTATLFFPLVLLGLLPLGTNPVLCQETTLFQELGIFAISAHSEHPELESSRGFGFVTSWGVAGPFRVRLSFHRESDDTRKEGTVCDNYSQRINCRPEMTRTSTTLGGLRGLLMWAPSIGERVRLGVGGGPSFNHIDAESVGTESGLDADLLAPNAGILGISTVLSAYVAPLSKVPLRVLGAFGVHWVNFDTCSANEPPQYDPYCGMESFREVELGLSYAF